MEKSGIRETEWLFYILMISHIVTDGICVLTANFATGAWVAIFVSGLVSLGIFFLLEKFINDPGVNMENVLGSKVYAFLSLLLFIITVFNAAERMKIFSYPIGEIVLCHSPGIFILFIMALASFAVAFTGIEAITRYSVIASGFFFVCIGVLVLTNISDAGLINIYPIGGKNGLINPFSGIKIFSDAVYFFFLKDHLKNNSKTRYPLSKVIIRVALTGVVICFFYSLCVPYPASGIYKYPLYRLAVLANSSVVFQRLDGVVYLIWVFFSFISSGTLALFAITVLADSLKIKNRKALCPAVVLLCFLLSLSRQNTGFMGSFAVSIFSFVLFPGAILWSRLRRKKI